MQPDTEAPPQPRLPKPESLEAKFKLLQTLPYDARVRRRHSIVYAFIVDWYHSKYGNALASVRHVVGTVNTRIRERDPAGKILFAGEVHSALTDLVSWGYLHQEKGSGRRASRYIPVWDLVCSVHKSPNATEDAPSVLETPNTSVLESPNTTGDSVRDFMNEDPLTPTRALDPGTGIGGQECAAPMAPPPAAGLSAAAAAGTAQDEFEQLWCTYDYKKNKREARAAFKKLAPDAEMFAKLLEAAGKWRASWAAQGASKAPRFRLDKWIEREEYDCEPPTGYQPKERKPAAKQLERAVTASDNDNLPDFMVGSPRLWPKGNFVGEFIEGVVEKKGGDIEVTLGFHVNSPGDHFGKVYKHRFYPQARAMDVQEQGQRTLEGICLAVDLPSVEDTDDLLFKPLRAIAGDNYVAYLPLPAEVAA
jgi:hypothetical protein